MIKNNSMKTGIRKKIFLKVRKPIYFMYAGLVIRCFTCSM